MNKEQKQIESTDNGLYTLLTAGQLVILDKDLEYSMRMNFIGTRAEYDTFISGLVEKV